MRRAALAAPLRALAVPAFADTPGSDPAAIPAAIRAMLDAALASGSDADIATIIKYARAADPGSADTVQQIASRWHDKKLAATEAKVRAATFLQLWTGKAELSGALTTGNSPTKGLSATLDLKREGLRWRQKVHAQGDYQESNGVATREHFIASYEPNFKLDDRAYLYGQAQFESDHFLGYDDRVSTSAGAGYSAVKTPRLQLDLELGPAYRYTEYTDRTEQSSMAARGSLDLKWKLLPSVSLTQTASAYVQRYNSTLASSTALNARLFGPLSAQISYNVQYESQPPPGSVPTDTTSRAGLAYNF